MRPEFGATLHLVGFQAGVRRLDVVKYRLRIRPVFSAVSQQPRLFCSDTVSFSETLRFLSLSTYPHHYKYLANIFHSYLLCNPAGCSVLVKSMVSFVKSGIVLVVITAAVLQLPLIQRFIRLLRLGLAIGKDIRPISDFTHQCHRVHDPLLEACEDMWISAKTRTLYLACSDPKGRGNWMPKYVSSVLFS